MDQSAELVSCFFCVPDLTGFTKIVANADANFTNEMIPALLRKLINANNLKLNVAEIEGDAVFFYRQGRLPSINQVIKQCDAFYQAFNAHIQSIEKSDEENYKKHLAHGQLGLKIVVHCGKIGTSNIKGRTKLIGSDVIIVHKLLKNRIPENEYVLFTEDYLKRVTLNKVDKKIDWKNSKSGSESYEYIGKVKYRYAKFREI